MGWMLVVSDDDTFQREALRRLKEREPVVGATGEQSACGLMGSIDVSSVLVDAADDVGRRFLSILRNLPATSYADIEILVVGPDREIPRFEASRNIDEALERHARS